MIEDGEASEQRKQLERRKLDALIGYCSSPRCRRQVLLEYFGETLAEPCGNCDLCLHPVPSFDGTVAAQKALSCAIRTGQRFGAAHLTDVLVGADTERIRQFRHNQLPTYGVGKEFSRVQWRDIFRQLVVHGLLVTDMEGHGGLRLGSDELCKPVLRGEKKVTLREDATFALRREVKSKRVSASEGPKGKPTLDNADDEQLFQRLRALRLELSKAQNVPPYVIFHDTTLIGLAKAQPKTLQEMGNISGIGAAKLERYGEAFLREIINSNK